MSLEDAALRFKAWAASKGILMHQPPDDLSEYETENLSDAAEVANPANAEDVLRRRRINFVGVNDADNAIVVVTHKAITQREMDILPTESDGITFRYLKGHAPTVRSPKTATMLVRPYDLHDDKYTCGSSVFQANWISAGTLGCLVRDSYGNVYGLSNNHVTGGCSYCPPNFPILAPGPADITPDGIEPFTIGRHRRVFPSWADRRRT